LIVAVRLSQVQKPRLKTFYEKEGCYTYNRFPTPNFSQPDVACNVRFFFFFFSRFPPSNCPPRGRNPAWKVPDPGKPAVLAGEGPDSAVLRPAERDPTVLAEERTAGSPNPEMQSPAIFGVWISSSRSLGCAGVVPVVSTSVRPFVGGCVSGSSSVGAFSIRAC
jgi:hypothetical protein